LSRTLWFRNLRGLNVSCGTEQVSVLFWSVLKTKRYTVRWVRDPKNHVDGLQYYNFRHVFEPPTPTPPPPQDVCSLIRVKNRLRGRQPSEAWCGGIFARDLTEGKWKYANEPTAPELQPFRSSLRVYPSDLFLQYQVTPA
jgi:hypothetical protein